MTNYTDEGAPDVVGAYEARLILGGVSRARLHELAQHDAFPPATKLRGGVVWDRASVVAFAQARTDERPRHDRWARARVARAYRIYGSIYAASKHTGVPTSTARRWLIDAGVYVPPEREEGDE